MKPCSFWSDSHQAANSPHCSTHGDRHPFACAEELRKELDAALLQLCEVRRLLALWATEDISSESLATELSRAFAEKRNGEKCKKCDLPLESEAHREECR